MGPSRFIKYKQVLLSSLIGFGILLGFILLLVPRTKEDNDKFVVRSIEDSPEIVIPLSASLTQERNRNCTYFNCFDVYKCLGNQISVYIYPIQKYKDENGNLISISFSLEFSKILQTIYDSRFYVNDPTKACIFIPSLDLLNQNVVHLKQTAQVLATLPYWNNGTNHLLFNMIQGSASDFFPVLGIDSDQAMIAGAGFSSWTYRKSFDVSLPAFNPSHHPFDLNVCKNRDRKWLLTSTQLNIHHQYRQELENLALAHTEFLVLNRCSGKENSNNNEFRCVGNTTYSYPEILKESTFCIVPIGERLGQLTFFDALKFGCIPVIITDGYVLPFSEVIDWKRASIITPKDNLPDVLQILKTLSPERISDMNHQVCFLWNKYLSSMERITTTVLEILNSRIFPQNSLTYEDWNDHQNSDSVVHPPIFHSGLASKSLGFTAVILTHDNLDSLIQVVQSLADVPSLKKVIIVWNNQLKTPPINWPKINKPLKVIQRKENRLSNRFYPYEDIETEAVLAIDDDIVMLTADELEFGFEVWSEFPDRIVGFPSRVHRWDNTTEKWIYVSEWTNEISMVLTSAAFYHAHYNTLYTNAMPNGIKNFVDDHKNCEDIAMNFLVANLTGKAPIKVTPRKKFRCPECVNVDILPSNGSYMTQRSDCINKFAESYGVMPLKLVEFRADPVLYKDNFPEKLKRFNDVGSL